MKFLKLNPFIRTVSLYEKINRTDECRGYDSRLIYLISGDLTATVDGEKLNHLGPGQLLYIPAGAVYKLKSKYLRAVVVAFDMFADENSTEDKIPPVQPADFDESRLIKSSLIPPFDKRIMLEDFESERDTFIRMNNIFTSAEGEYRAQISAMLKLILLKISEIVEEDALPARMVEELDNYIREYLAIIPSTLAEC